MLVTVITNGIIYHAMAKLSANIVKYITIKHGNDFDNANIV